jgi:hypothetical protein
MERQKMATSTGTNMRTLLSALAVFSASFAVPQNVQRNSTAPAPAVTAAARAPVPFGSGEKMEYRAKYGLATVGKGQLEVAGITTLRGRPAWNVQMRVSGQVLFLYKLDGLSQSWMDTTTLHTLQFQQEQVERGKKRERFFEIFPDRSVFRQRATPDTLPEMPSVSEPLDDVSFVYFLRTIPLVVGETDTFPRYFRPDRNPVVIRVLGKEEITVPAGIFPAIVIQPTIKTPSGIFKEGAETKVWISDDPSRMILKIYSKTNALAALHLEMTKYTPPKVRGK